jgi:hypothetical protein
MVDGNPPNPNPNEEIKFVILRVPNCEVELPTHVTDDTTFSMVFVQVGVFLIPHNPVLNSSQVKLDASSDIFMVIRPAQFSNVSVGTPFQIVLGTNS